MGARSRFGKALAHGTALVNGTSWFDIRSEHVSDELEEFTEGAKIEGQDVVLVDDLVSDGEPLIETAMDVRDIAGANVVAVVPLVDLQLGATKQFAEELPQVKYRPILTKSQILNRRTTRSLRLRSGQA
jgi:orotate phosphoribosyltransferase